LERREKATAGFYFLATSMFEEKQEGGQEREREK